ncbi:hypothetical protein GUJ93_ZPchr0003g18115 [Zizania palustris]|uniref:Pinin/SDK/MemA protein domain-containing protein n=1 Tax=Zizania palustris TaxID=103762 RepID=A0A8J5RXQ9_ZIZPA|nr:hypothetical protein GUJ93_ZPchr0003g18115 [Zizania palustris]
MEVDDNETEGVKKDAEVEGQADGSAAVEGGERWGSSNGGFRRDGNQRLSRRMELDMPLPEPLPREFPKDEDPSLVKRNKRMLGKLLVGTLEKFQQEDKKMSNTEAYMRRSETQRKQAVVGLSAYLGLTLVASTLSSFPHDATGFPTATSPSPIVVAGAQGDYEGGSDEGQDGKGDSMDGEEVMDSAICSFSNSTNDNGAEPVPQTLPLLVDE